MLKRLPGPARIAMVHITNLRGILMPVHPNGGQERLRARPRIWVRLVRFAQAGDYAAMGAMAERLSFRYDPARLFSLALVLLVLEAHGRFALGLPSYLPVAVLLAGLAFLLLSVQCFRRNSISHLLLVRDWPVHSYGQSLRVVVLRTEGSSV